MSIAAPTGLVTASAPIAPFATVTQVFQETSTLQNGQTTLITTTRKVSIIDSSQYSSILASESSTTSSSSIFSSSSPTTTTSHQTSHSSTDTLSLAAKAGIGVGAALGVILLIILTILLFRCQVQVSLKPRKKGIPMRKSTGEWMWIGGKAELEAKDGTQGRYQSMDAEMRTPANRHEADSPTLLHPHWRCPKDAAHGPCELAADSVRDTEEKMKSHDNESKSEK